MSITFQVDNVALATELIKTVKAKEVIDYKVKSKTEACTDLDLINYWSGMNGFLTAVHTAFDEHRPLSLSPDSFWLTISNGLATHINLNAEKLRHKFVDHEGKKTIVVHRDSFVKGSPDNNWPGCFNEFSDQLAKYIGKKRDLIVSNFSTTGVTEKAASEIVLMDAMQSYFEYKVRTACGFPSITLEGTTEDWHNLLHRVQCLREFDLDWWIDHLEPVMHKVVATAEGDIDTKFWQSFLKVGGGSGGPYITGWINTLYPYLKKNYRNYGMEYNRRLGSMCGGPHPDSFPVGLSSVPFEWKYYNTTYSMKFIGGIIGVSQANDLTLRPEAGWAVKEEKEHNENS